MEPEEDTYEQVTGRRAFSLVMDNIRRVKAADLPLTIAVTPSAYMTDAEQILHVLDKEKLPFAINASILPPRPETGRELADASLDTYIAVLKLRSQLKGRELLLEEEPESLPDPGGKQKDPVLGVTCGAGRSGFAIDGKVICGHATTFPVREKMLYLWAFMRRGKEQIILQPITPCRWSATAVLTMGYVCIV